MREFEPSASKGIGKGLRVLVEAPGDFLVGRVHAQRHIRRGHHRRMLQRRVMSIRNQVLGFAVDRRPLLGTGWALGQLPLVAQKHVEVAVVPGSWVGLPRAFNTAGGGVHAFASAELVAPAQALLFHACSLGFRANQCWITGTVSLTKGVTTGHQGHGLFVVHGHTGKGFAYITAGGDGIWIAVGAFWVHIDQAHLHGSQGVF